MLCSCCWIHPHIGLLCAQGCWLAALLAGGDGVGPVTGSACHQQCLECCWQASSELLVLWCLVHSSRHVDTSHTHKCTQAQHVICSRTHLVCVSYTPRRSCSCPYLGQHPLYFVSCPAFLPYLLTPPLLATNKHRPDGAAGAQHKPRGVLGWSRTHVEGVCMLSCTKAKQAGIARCRMHTAEARHTRQRTRESPMGRTPLFACCLLTMQLQMHSITTDEARCCVCWPDHPAPLRHTVSTRQGDPGGNWGSVQVRVLTRVGWSGGV